uniref:GCV_T domain-containing protein n=1 Tax=Angiostrongylus cantonensis TaxID=6313 RepID=A0A0K0CZ90_ANGCA
MCYSACVFRVICNVALQYCYGLLQLQMSSIRGLSHRSVLILRGADSLKLLQGLVTNDVRTVSPLKGIAALFLDTKGRIVDDVIISRDNGDILVECSASNRKNLKSILEKYRMRKTVEIIESHYHVFFSTEEAENSFPDPRFSSLGRRFYSAETECVGPDVYHERRMEHGIAEGCEELGGLLPFQINGDFLNMVSLDKGCYIGQELTARTAHTGVIRRRILPVKCVSPLKRRSIITQDDKKVGQVISCGSVFGLALLSLSAFGRSLTVEGLPVVPYKPSWMPDSALSPREKFVV